MVDSNPNFTNQIGRRIRDARENAGFTQQQLAEKLGITQQILSKIENGKYGIRVEVIKAVATLCHVPVAFFVQESTDTAEAMLLFDQLDPVFKKAGTEMISQLLKIQQLGHVSVSFLAQAQEMSRE
jgi:transcriptional regulator with XRE-family HTH domain